MGRTVTKHTYKGTELLELEREATGNSLAPHTCAAQRVRVRTCIWGHGPSAAHGQQQATAATHLQVDEAHDE